jgi:hypothetical protein
VNRRLDSESVISEDGFLMNDRDCDEQAAYAVAAWLQRADLSGSPESFFSPPLTPEEHDVAAVEEWILVAV